MNPRSNRSLILEKPGIVWVLLGLLVLFVTDLWAVFYYLGFPLSRQWTARIGGTLGIFSLLLGCRRYSSSYLLVNRLNLRSTRLLQFWRILLVLLFVLGLFNENGLTAVIRELLVFWILGEFLVVGLDRVFWQAIELPLTVAFYTATIAMLFLYDIPVPLVEGDNVFYVDSAERGGRYTWSLAYTLRPFTSSGLFLGIIGIIKTQRNWLANLQAIAPIFFFVTEVGLFQFRSVALLLALTVASLLILRPLLERRKRPTTSVILFVCCLVSIGLFSQTEAFELLMKRAQVIDGDVWGIFDSRWKELEAFRSDLRWEVLWGRGLGGSFDASAVFFSPGSAEWRTLHFGIAVFLLKGGCAMLFAFFGMLAPGMALRERNWYGDTANLTAALYFPLLLYQIALSPIFVSPVALFGLIPMMLVLARFHDRSIARNPL